jgi:hypothetical protein
MDFVPFSFVMMASLICVSFLFDVVRGRSFPMEHLPDMLSTGFGASMIMFLYSTQGQS